ncbi:MAG: glycosyltransferase, partial [Gammaproteobacteria bacterium]
MKASVVIPVKNGGALLVDVLKKVLAQRAPWPFEVLAIDSGSRDGSLEHIRELGVRLHEIPPREFG